MIKYNTICENKNKNWNTGIYVCISYHGFIKYWNLSEYQ